MIIPKLKCPSDWKVKSLRELADIRISNVDKKYYPRERRVQLCNYLDVYNNDSISGDLEFMQATATDAEILRFKVDLGDVIITKDSETPDDIGVPTVVRDEIPNLVCGYHLALIKPDQRQIVPGFLARQLSHARVIRHFALSANGITRYGLSTAAIENAPIWLPLRDEQRRITDVLDINDEAIRRTDAVIAKLRKIKAGLLHDLLAWGCDKNGQLRGPNVHHEHFKECTLGEITPLRRERGRQGLPTMSVTMHDGLQLRDPTDRRVETRLLPEQHLLARRGDIAYNMMRMWQGACGLAAEDCLLSPAYVVVVPTGIVPAFTYLLFKMPETVQKFHKVSRGLTDDRLRLYHRDFAKIVVSVPKSLLEQQVLVDVLASHENRISSEEAYRDKLKLQKRGLMHDLLTGVVRV